MFVTQVGGEEVHLPDVQPGRGPAPGHRQIRRCVLLLSGGAAERGRAQDGPPVHVASHGKEHSHWARASLQNLNKYVKPCLKYSFGSIS